MKLGHVSLDGSKVDANASKHKAMSYDRMQQDEQRLQAQIRDLLARAEEQDRADDARLGAGVAESDLPAELKRRKDRLARIRAAIAALETDARETRAAQLRVQAERAREVAASTGDPAEHDGVQTALDAGAAEGTRRVGAGVHVPQRPPPARGAGRMSSLR